MAGRIPTYLPFLLLCRLQEVVVERLIQRFRHGAGFVCQEVVVAVYDEVPAGFIASCFVGCGQGVSAIGQRIRRSHVLPSACEVNSASQLIISAECATMVSESARVGRERGAYRSRRSRAPIAASRLQRPWRLLKKQSRASAMFTSPTLYSRLAVSSSRSCALMACA
jgi:hypothetical protein